MTRAGTRALCASGFASASHAERKLAQGLACAAPSGTGGVSA
jgi:hypothetical protein